MRIEAQITGANAKIRRSITGRYILVKSADNEIRISGKGFEDVHMGAGEEYELPFEHSGQDIYIQNTVSGTTNFIMEVTPQRLRKANQNELTVNTTAVVENGNDNADLPSIEIAAGSSVAVCIANTSRKYLRVSLLSDAAGYVLMGKNTVDAERGGPIEPGQTSFEETTGALWVHNPQGEPVRVWLMEVNKI